VRVHARRNATLASVAEAKAAFRAAWDAAG
jgi:hypothetical protein